MQQSARWFVWLVGALLFFAQAAPTLAYSVSDPAPDFDPENLISDADFRSSGAYSVAEVEQFLGKQGPWSSRDGGVSWLLNYDIQESQQVAYKFRTTSGTCSDWNYVSVPQRNDATNEQLHNRSVAQLLVDESVSHGINPGVVLTLIQRESSAITDATIPNQVREGWILGYGYNERLAACDYTEAEARQQAIDFGGVGQQIAYATAWLQRCFDGTNASPTPWACRGLSSWYGDPFPTYDGATIAAKNRATRVLYVYTPRVYNGNYVFSKQFEGWFGTGGFQPDAVVLVNGAYQAVYQGHRWQLPIATARQWGITLAGAQAATTQQLSYRLVGLWPEVIVDRHGYWLIRDRTPRIVPPAMVAHLPTSDSGLMQDAMSWLVPGGFQPDAVVLVNGAYQAVYQGHRWQLPIATARQWGITLAGAQAATTQQLSYRLVGLWPEVIVDRHGYWLIREKERQLVPPSFVAHLPTSDSSLFVTAIQALPRRLPVVGFFSAAGQWTPFYYRSQTGVLYGLSGGMMSAYAGFSSGEVAVSGSSLQPQVQLRRHFVRVAEGDPQIYLADLGRLYPVSSSLYSAYQVALTGGSVDTVPYELTSKLTLRAPLTNLLRESGGSSTAYLIQNGRKRPISAQAWVRLGYRDADVTYVSSGFLASLPLGTTVQ